MYIYIKLFWVVITVNVNADKDRGTVNPLVESRNKALAGSMDESPEIIPVWGFLLRP